MSKELFTLGELHVADFLKPEESPHYPPVEMKLMLADNGVAHLEKTAPAESMWQKNYWYRSSTNQTMRKQLKNVVDSILDVYKVDSSCVWTDIASNDGYLLSCVPKEVIKIGIDPAPKSFKLECEKYADLVIQDYFSASSYKNSKYGNKKVNVATCISMFYDIKTPVQFLQDLHDILDDNGLAVIQCSYTPLMIQQLAYDNLCHEHYAYYSLFNLMPILKTHGFQVMDCELNNTNAGSFRIYAMKLNADVSLFGSPTHRDVAQYRIKSILEYEKTLALDEVTTWRCFFSKINELKKQTIEFLQTVTAEGKTVAGYGASTKSATTCQYFGLNEYLDYMVDRSPYKHGLKTVDGIPIISEDEFRAEPCDYLIIFPFHFLQEFMERESNFLMKGGTMIVLSPEFRLITKNDL